MQRWKKDFHVRTLLLEAGQSRKSRGFWGKKACMRKAIAGRKNNTHACKEGDSWKEEQHTHMGEIHNDGKVGVLVRYCKRMKNPKCINIYT